MAFDFVFDFQGNSTGPSLWTGTPKKMYPFTQQVAFHQFYFIDNGKTAVVQTSRVSADYQGTGMWKVFRKYQLLLLEQYPNVTHVAFISSQKKLHVQRWKDGKTGSKFIMSRVSLF